MVLEQAGKPLASAGRIAGQHNLVLTFPKLTDVFDDFFVYIDVLRPLRRKVVSGVDSEGDHLSALRLREGRDKMDLPLRQCPGPFLAAKVERRRWQRAIAPGLGDHRPLA